MKTQLTGKVIDIYHVIAVFSAMLSNYIQVEEPETLDDTLQWNKNLQIRTKSMYRKPKQSLPLLLFLMEKRENEQRNTSLRRSSLASLSSNGRGGSSAEKYR